MKFEKISIGGWYQRTMLHLSEIFDYLRFANSPLNLEPEKLKKLHDNLRIKEINYGVDGLEYLKIQTEDEIFIKIFEDGLITLSSFNVEADKLDANIAKIADYYENYLSPAFSYLFSLGAPIPKELANIKTIYPYFIVLNNEPLDNIKSLLGLIGEPKHFEYNTDEIDVVRGNLYYFINNKGKNPEQIERFIEEQIFFREFKGQLHRYLNLHRTIWELIADVKEQSGVRGKEILAFTSKIDGYAKTINLIESRINQMNTYLRTRSQISKSDDDLKHFVDIMEFRYSTLADTLAYVQQVWNMTKNYVNSAKGLFSDLQQEVTHKAVNNLTIVTSMGVGASLIGLFTTRQMPEITVFGLFYFLALAFVGYTVNKIIRTISNNRKYEISDIDYDKDI